jgi:hypothetical protein
VTFVTRERASELAREKGRAETRERESESRERERVREREWEEKRGGFLLLNKRTQRSERELR